MSLSDEETISIVRQLSDEEYNKYVEDFYKDYNMSTPAFKGKKTRTMKKPNLHRKSVLSLDAGRMF